MFKSLLLVFFLIFLPAQDIREQISSYQADKSALERKFPNDLSESYFARFDVFYENWLMDLEKVNFESLNRDDQIDFILLRNTIRKNQYEHIQDKNSFQELKQVIDFAGPINLFLENRKKAVNPKSQLLASDYNAVNKLLLKKTEDIKKITPFDSWQKAEMASDIVKNLVKSIDEAYNFYKDYNPDFYWWMQEPHKELKKNLEIYQSNLKGHFKNTSVKDDGSGIIGKPIGRDNLIKDLQFEFVDYTPEELITEANKQFAWCEKEMLKASAEMGYGSDWKKAIEKVKQTYVPAGQWQEDVNGLANEAIKYLEDRDLITIPPLAKESWRTVMLSAEAQKQSPFFLGGEQIMVAYPTIDMSHDQKMMSMRGNNPHFSRATVQHELIPGHHLQQFMNQRYKPHRRLFYTPFWTEGWALYWEFNLWDKNFPRSPEDKVGMLFWRMHRCARIIFSLNYHLGKMTPKECITLLVDKVGHEPANAEAEVRRSFTGRYGPLYQIAYMMGGLQFYSLRKELVDSRQMKEKDFHDTILQHNSIPVELVKVILKNEKLTKDYKTNWKFLK
jgi:uncharacterized protein (DUF885 family)